jgi:predicted nucleotidyltransferase component of viral defense system
MANSLHLDILPENQLKLFERLSTQSFLNDFYLAGGTGLALYLGHRQSIDFDFFIPVDFDTSVIINKLMDIGNYRRDNEERNTINGSLDGIKISFFGYRYKTIDKFFNYNNIRLAGLKDIAAMKMEAIAGRGSKKDFIDIFFLLQRYTLNEIFEFHTLKYGTGLSNRYHHLKSLVYFTDADTEAMPLMIKPLNWDDVKNQILSCVRQYRIG